MEGNRGFYRSKILQISGKILNKVDKDNLRIENNKVVKKTLFGKKVTHVIVSLDGETKAILSIKSLSKRTGLSKTKLNKMTSEDILAVIEEKVKKEFVESSKQKLLEKSNKFPETLSEDLRKDLDKFNNDGEFILKMAKGNLAYLSFAHDDLKKDKDFLLKALILQPDFPIPQELKKDKDLGSVLLQEAKKNGNNFQYLKYLDPVLAKKLQLEYVKDKKRVNKDILPHLQPDVLKEVRKRNPHL